MMAPRGLPFLAQGYCYCLTVILFTCVFKNSQLVAASTFCSANIEDVWLNCTNTSVIFIHKLLSHEINDYHPNCLRELKEMCNMQKSCTLPSVCKRLSHDTYVAYGCVPEAREKIQCSNTQVPFELTHRAFLISPSYPRIFPLWEKRCLWRLKAVMNGTISVYVLDIVGKPDLVVHSYPFSSVGGRKNLISRALSINITSDQTVDLTLSPNSKVWMAIELGEISNKNATLRDHFFCRPIKDSSQNFRTICGSCSSNLAGMRIALIIMSCIILILIGCLCITVHCYCKKYKSFESHLRAVEAPRHRQMSAVTPYHTTVVQPLMTRQTNGKPDTDRYKKTYKEHNYDHLNNFHTVNYNLNQPQTVKIEPHKQKQYHKHNFEDDDSDSTYATVGENT